MPQKFKDNGRALLVGSITAGALSLTVEASKADRYPAANTTNWLAPSDWFKVVLINSAGDREVIRVGTRTLGSGVFGNLLRAQDGTVALAFTAGTATAGTAVVQAPFAADLENCLAGAFPTLDVAGKMKQGTIEGRFTPVGGIIMWSGALAAIPAGWGLCDGTAGKPDLRDRFIMGAGGVAAVGVTGGFRNSSLVEHGHSVIGNFTTGTESALHTHAATVNDPGHAHTFASGGVNSGTGGKANSLNEGQFATEPAATNISVAIGTEQQQHTHALAINIGTGTAGGTAVDNNLPPYYVLAMIICLVA